MRRFFSSVVLAVATFGVVSATSCSSTPSDAVDPALADVVFQGQATDEGLTALLAAKVQDDPTRAANFSWQSAGDQLPLTPIPLFCWHIGSTAARVEPQPVDPQRFDPAGAGERQSPPSLFGDAHPVRDAARSAARSLAEELLSGVRVAHAHGTPMSGAGYLLVFSTAKQPKLLRVFTTATEYTPNQAAWQKITTTGELVHVQLTNADFDQDRIAQGGGPYRGTEITFTFPAK